MLTFLKSGIQPAQQTSRPQGAMPPRMRASSRMPTCRNSMRRWNTLARSRTSSRKSTRPSEVNVNTTLLPSKVNSQSMSFMGSSRAAIFSLQMRIASGRRASCSASTALSRSVAMRMTFLSGWTTDSSGTSRNGSTTMAYSRPRAVSTMTPCPCSSVRPPAPK